jgi:hypothetical protein
VGALQAHGIKGEEGEGRPGRWQVAGRLGLLGGHGQWAPAVSREGRLSGGPQANLNKFEYFKFL